MYADDFVIVALTVSDLRILLNHCSLFLDTIDSLTLIKAIALGLETDIRHHVLTLLIMRPLCIGQIVEISWSVYSSRR